MKYKTIELDDELLDFMVAKACDDGNGNSMESFIHMHKRGFLHYSEQWGLGGPIIERERIQLSMASGSTWIAKPWSDNFCTTLEQPVQCHGKTPLTAAMRCFVASKFGPEVET